MPCPANLGYAAIEFRDRPLIALPYPNRQNSRTLSVQQSSRESAKTSKYCEVLVLVMPNALGIEKFKPLLTGRLRISTLGN